MFMRVARPSALDDGGCGLLGFLANSWQNGLLVTIPVEGESENRSILKLAGATGLEPATSCVRGKRSNQLNFAPAN
jgi:hypothetical protein